MKSIKTRVSEKLSGLPIAENVKKAILAHAYKARINKHGNIKLGGVSWAYSKLMGNESLTAYKNGPAIIAKLGCDVTGTCGGFCAGCKNKCYVRASYRYKSVLFSHACNTIASREILDIHHESIREQLARAKQKPSYFRINQSGEIESISEMLEWMKTARENPDCRFWLYSKNRYAITAFYNAWCNGDMPENMVVLVSIWHEQNLQLYKLVSACPNIKAFVYDDGLFDYDAAGLHIQTYCRAYDENGKLNHDITCEKCKKCFMYSSKCKLIGCKAH